MKMYPDIDLVDGKIKMLPNELKCVICWWQFLPEGVNRPVCPKCGSTWLVSITGDQLVFSSAVDKMYDQLVDKCCHEIRGDE